MGTSFRRKPEARADKTGDIWGGEEERKKEREREKEREKERKEEERLWDIRRQIFRTVSGEPMQGYLAVEDSLSVAGLESGLAITALLFLVTAKGIMNFFSGRRKTRGKKLNRSKK